MDETWWLDFIDGTINFDRYYNILEYGIPLTLEFPRLDKEDYWLF